MHTNLPAKGRWFATFKNIRKIASIGLAVVLVSTSG
jgi:hypothetical protein